MRNLKYSKIQITITILFLIGVPGTLFFRCSSETDEHRPNIILILADDLGFSDLCCYGGEIETPNLDYLARNGLRFSQFYNGARCCPTRASLLTGLYAHQTGIGHMTENLEFQAYTGELSNLTPTIAEVLKKSGYLTYMAGKWHVTQNTRLSDLEKNRPLNRGFDHFYGTLPGHGSFWDPAGLMEDEKFIEPEGDYDYTEAISDYACRYIREATRKGNPFFLYVAYTAPHYPLHARKEIIRKYEKTFKTGWDTIRKSRHERLIENGLIESKWKLSERDEMSNPWEEDTVKNWQAHRMAVFAAMVDHMDQGIGRIVNELKTSGTLNNSVIIFLSDNGGSAEGHLYNTIERLGNPWISSLIPDSTRDGKRVNPGDWPGEFLGGPDTYGSYGLKWANVSNSPFRLHKS